MINYAQYKIEERENILLRRKSLHAEEPLGNSDIILKI